MDNNGLQWTTMDIKERKYLDALNIYFTKYSGKARFLKGG